ncbi:coiled-coil domain-containing protein 34-like [Aricia agestis]|uniref:coiled-coil domain-containing protein 34-like n=1 Tax=Aricia agestis TaxID=91739 RepID=UPI001C207E70|nr:coiled-coil domain-containing protein 34-like [Aricia agestis]
MTSDIENYGDSARNRSTYETKRRTSNHIFDGAGENIQYYSDSESLDSRKSKTRFINPAIRIENVLSSSSSVDASSDEVTPHPHTYRSSSTPFLTGRISNASCTSVQRKSCRLDPGEEETPRCEYDGADTFRLSVASVSTTTTAREEREKNEKRRQEAFQKWLERKEQERREKARQDRMKTRETPATTPEQREESYRRWLERKQAQAERRKAEEILQRIKEKERMERERKSRENKDEKLMEWIKRKEEEMKLMKTRAERRAARAAIEEERRRVQGERAYRDWLRTSRGKPLPVPLNRGELSMRGSVSQMYVNPIPWQSLT